MDTTCRCKAYLCLIINIYLLYLQIISIIYDYLSLIFIYNIILLKILKISYIRLSTFLW